MSEATSVTTRSKAKELLNQIENQKQSADFNKPSCSSQPDGLGLPAGPGSRQTSKVTGSRSARSNSSVSSHLSAKIRSEILKAKIQSEIEINKIQQRQFAERFAFEENLMKEKRAQQSIEEERQLKLDRMREEQARHHQHELNQARLQGELNETLAEMAENNESLPASVCVSAVANCSVPIVNECRLSNDVNAVFSAPSSTYPQRGSSLTDQPQVVFHAKRPIFNECRPSNDVSAVFNTPSSTHLQCSDASLIRQPQAVSVAGESPILQSANNANADCANLSSTKQPSRLSYVAKNVEYAPTNVHVQTQSKNEILGPHNAHLNIPEPSKSNVGFSMFPHIPTLEPQTFDGNPANYYNFIDSFDALISFSVPEPKRKLYFLLQYTTGPAHALVKGCQYMPSDQGYFQARELLQQTFGQKFQIARACTDTLITGPNLNHHDKASLLKFSAELNSCMNTLISMNYLHKIDNFDILSKIAKRLPQPWINGWQAELDSIVHVKREEVSLKHLANYVSLKTRQATNFECNWTQKTQPKPLSACAKPFKPRKESAFASQIAIAPKTESAKCKLCQGSHYLNQCKRFRKLSVSDRLKFVNENRLCRSCLEVGHFAKQCSRENPCRKPGCLARHTTLLHPICNSPEPTREANDNSSPAGERKVLNAYADLSSRSEGLLPILAVKIRLKDSETWTTTRAFLDSGSTGSFITTELMKQLQIAHQPTVDVTLSTLNQAQKMSKCMLISNLEICDYDESEFLHLQPLLSIDNLPISLEDIPTQADVSQFPEFDSVHIPEINAEVGLLIGNDNRHLLKPVDVISSDDDHYAIKTAIGWIVSCPKHGGETSIYGKKCFFVKSNSKINHPMCTLCADVIDSLQSNEVPLSREQSCFMRQVTDSIQLRADQHYEIALPFRHSDISLPNNKSQVERRTNYLKRRFLSNPKFFEDYKCFVNDMINNGFAEKVLSPVEKEGLVWYLPHHGVYHPTKPNKLRVVFDCASKYKGICLNDCLLQGPNITNSLLGVLFRFRRGPFAIQGDIRSMFHMVRVPEHQRDFLRFLWWDNCDLNTEPQVYRMCVFLFGTVCSPACANFALKKTALDHQTEFGEATINAVNECFYVDDCLASAFSVEQAKLLLHELVDLLSKGGFELTKWASNNREVLASVPVGDRSKELTHLDLTCNPLPDECALGLRWEVESDTLCFRTKTKHKPATRRGILSVINSLYDPLGFSAPVIQPVKVLLQSLCKTKLGWDDPIPIKSERQWNDWLKQLSLLSSFQITRCYQPSVFGDVANARIHHFSDASQQSYGYVSYLRLVDSFGTIHCSFLLGKTKLTPMKTLTTPRLELCAATLSIRYDALLCRELKLPYDLQPSLFWTDSTTVLKYINCENKSFHVFVANRVQAIRDRSQPQQWKYVNTKENPADCPSRGAKIAEFLDCDLWKFGPPFLWLPESSWPEQPFVQKEDISELEVKQQPTVSCLATVAKDAYPLQFLITKFSSWRKLCRVCAWIFRAKNAFLAFSKKVTNVKTQTSKHLAVDEVRAAEILIIASIQQRCYQKEFASLKTNKSVQRSSTVAKLDPFLEGKILRVGGRFKHSSFPYSLKHPIIIPKNSPVTSSIINDAHIVLGHAGRDHVLSFLREKFWIINANSAVRKVLSNCITCKKMFSTTCNQKMAQLPAERLTPNKPAFTWVGLDYFGPFLTRHGRSNHKRYGVIFSCLGTRAVHIEIAYSLDTSSFIMALRRFVSRRGQVTRIISDNGTNLKGGERELRQAILNWNNEQVHSFLLQRGIDWVFNPPGASHHGAVFERQIRSFRKIFSGVALEQRLTDEAFLTLSCEVEAIMNSRPLTTVSDDPNDLEPITPNHLLLLKAPNSLPPGVFDARDLHSRKLWRQVQYLANIFWTRWVKEYVPNLQLRHKWTHSKRNLAPGDLVLICDHSLPRGTWPMGRILDVFPDSAGHVRTVRVKTKNSTLVRPITKLVLLLPHEP